MALMHDAHEAYIGDLSGGLKYLLRDSVLKELILKLDLAIEYAIPNLSFDTLRGDAEALTWAEEQLVPRECADDRDQVG
jgi:5'-deoxynucleotidase YfbR-like HD superfamily hydrolase